MSTWIKNTSLNVKSWLSEDGWKMEDISNREFPNFLEVLLKFSLSTDRWQILDNPLTNSELLSQLVLIRDNGQWRMITPYRRIDASDKEVALEIREHIESFIGAIRI